MIVYTGPNCPACVALKRYLDGRGVAYQEVDVFTDAEAGARLNDLNISSIPVIEWPNGEIDPPGFQPDRVESQLRKWGG